MWSISWTYFFSFLRSTSLKFFFFFSYIFSSSDSNTCCGTHVKDLGDIQLVKLLFTEKFKTNCRVWFISGNRILKYVGSSIFLERQLQLKLQQPPIEFLKKIDQIQKNLKLSNEKNKFFLQEIAILNGKSILLNALEKKLNLVVHHRIDGTSEYMTAISITLAGQEIVKKGKQPILKFPFVLFLIISEENSLEGHIVLYGPDEILKQIEGSLINLLEVKGRCANGEFRGRAGNLKRLKEVEEELQKIVDQNQKKIN